MIRLYIDTSALVKRAFAEPDSPALVSALRAAADDGCELVTSSLALVEVARACRSRLEHDHPRRLAELQEIALSGISDEPITDDVVGVARRIGPPVLRSLDAIHLATATLLDVDEFWTYDARLRAAADGQGFLTRSPR